MPEQTAAAVALACGSCPYVWEPADVGPAEFAGLVGAGCPECGGWVWLGQLDERGAVR